MNPFESQFMEYVWGLLCRLPIFLAAGGGIVWAIMNWKKAPTPALYAALACALLLLVSCAFPAMVIWIPSMIARGNAPLPELITRLRWTNRAIIGMGSLCTAISIGALIFAAFAARAALKAGKEKDRDRRRRDDDDDRDDVDERIKSR